MSEDGITININGQEKQIYFECVLVLGDNLGLNTKCGFAESFAAKRYCRICNATSSECQDMTTEHESFIRTVESYNADVLRNDYQNTGSQEKCF